MFKPFPENGLILLFILAIFSSKSVLAQQIDCSRLGDITYLTSLIESYNYDNNAVQTAIASCSSGDWGNTSPASRYEKKRSTSTESYTNQNTYNTTNENTKNTSNKNDWDQPHSGNGTSCIKLTGLESKLITSSKEHCPRTSSYGACRDISYRYEVQNMCNAKMDFKWRFISKHTYFSQAALKPGGKKIVSCRQSLNQCKGKIEYSWRRSTY